MWSIIAAQLAVRINLALIGFNIMLSVKPKSANANQKKQQQGHGQSGWELVHGKTKDGKERKGRRTRQMWHVFECAGVGLNQRFLRNCQKNNNSEEGEKYVKAVSKALKTVQDDCDYGRRQLQQGCPSQQRTHTHKHTHTHTCKQTYKLHLCGLCPFGAFWRINGSPGPLWRVHFQVRVQLKVQLRFQVQCHPMRNAIKTNYQIYV